MKKELDSHTKNMIVKLDGWSNVLTGLGRSGKDKRTGMLAEWCRMDWDQIESIYSCDAIAEKIVDVPVEEAFRKDPIFVKKDMDGDFNKEMWDYLNEIGFMPKFLQAAKWGRLYGGGFLMFGIADGADPDLEVEFDSIKSVDWTSTLHRWDMNSVDVVHDVSSPYFREPESYIFSRGALDTSNLSGPRIHRSRVVRFEGARLPERLYRSNNYFNDSVLNKIQNSLKNFNSSHDGIALLMQDFAGGVFKMKNLAQLIGAGQDDAVMKRLQLIDLKRSMVKSVVVDADEDYQRKTTPLAGIKDVLGKVGDKLVADSKFPHTILLGEGSTGSMSGAGESEQEGWDDYIRGLQMSDYKPAFMACLKILLSAKDNPVTKGEIPEGFDMKFPPLQESSPKEKAEVYKITADADKVYIEAQVLDPDEVAISRFSDDEFNQDTQIETDIREASLNAGNTTESDLPEDGAPADPEMAASIEGVAKASLNGAQVRSMIDVVTQFKTGVLDRGSALTILTTAFPIGEQEAIKILGKDSKLPPGINPEPPVTKVDGFVQDHHHDFGPQIMTSGMQIKNDDSHTHTYWVSGVKYETNPSDTGVPHTHELMHRKGSTGPAMAFEKEVRIDAIEKDGSMFVLMDTEGKKVLGRFKSKKQAEAAKKDQEQKYEDENEPNPGKKGPELLPKDD